MRSLVLSNVSCVFGMYVLEFGVCGSYFTFRVVCDSGSGQGSIFLDPSPHVETLNPKPPW